MKRNILWKPKVSYLVIVLFMLIGFSLIFSFNTKKSEENKKTLEVMVIGYFDNQMILEDNNHFLYYMNDQKYSFDVGSHLLLEYSGVIDKSIVNNITSYQVLNETDSNTLPNNWVDDGIFSDYYTMAYNKLKTMSQDEKISQVLLIKYPNNGINIQKEKQFGGFIFYEKDFQDKSKKDVNDMIDSIQKVSQIPLLTATDEEGGKVVRVSSNNKLAREPFKSVQELYNEGGFSLIKSDTIKKSEVLSDLGINLNLAPVVDVSENSRDYIYERTIGENAIITSEYAKTVIEASKKGNVSYTLKHFPGYSSNIDTHTWVSIDDRTMEEINSDLLPFKEGIKSGAEAVMVSHNIVKTIDSNNPSSLSFNVHNLLRNDLLFTGISISDDLDMASLDNVSSKYVKALLSGNDLIITGDYEYSISEIKDAISSGMMSQAILDYHVFKVLSWKYYKGLMFDEK